ncbi:ATP-dependent Clp protease proteolytic subunit [Campylobacter ureolyticus]|uniref:ATP-dependent Clp protease proteolytic subunit n=1 Tax=Campylobacter ureolyticus TaxID=827 RepID=UPI0022B4C5D0|nr:ATP-dependent Clp protease proteolytic subunit [Campylobacter ureolyticus]MCZ6155525.1 ATP-dependent Clp protease proteolytic subunit [Campylobacter ureolyticus]
MDEILKTPNLVLENELFKKRHIFLNSPIDFELTEKINLMLLNLESNSDSKPIFLHISSPGGIVYAGLSIIDMIETINAPVYTYATGLVASMAAIIFAVGDKRYMGKNTRYMIHQPSGGAIGKLSDMQTSIDEAIRLKEVTAEILADNSGKTPKDEILKMLEKDCFLSSDECLKLGFCDEIMTAKKVRI